MQQKYTVLVARQQMKKFLPQEKNTEQTFSINWVGEDI